MNENDIQPNSVDNQPNTPQNPVIIENNTPPQNTASNPNVNAGQNVYYGQTPPVYQVPNYTINQVTPVPLESKALAIASMILGIISLICCCAFPFAIPCSACGLVLAIICLSTKKGGKPFAIAGLILTIIALITSVSVLILFIADGSINFYNEFPNIDRFSSFMQNIIHSI